MTFQAICPRPMGTPVLQVSWFTTLRQLGLVYISSSAASTADWAYSLASMRSATFSVVQSRARVTAIADRPITVMSIDVLNT